MLGLVVLRDDTSCLRTVPVVLRHGERQLQVNALLDDSSTQTYLNADVAAELGFNGPAEQITVSVLNGQVKTFSSMQVDVEISSIDETADNGVYH